MRYLTPIIALALVLSIVAYIFPNSEDRGDSFAMWSDATIRAEILEHPSLWFKHLKVTTDGRTITLRGELEDRKQLDTLLTLVRSNPFVEEVHNRIILRNKYIPARTSPPQINGEKTTLSSADAEIAHRAKIIIHNNRGTRDLPITVTAKNSKLYIDGEVTDKLAIVELQTLLSDIPGVSEVILADNH